MFELEARIIKDDKYNDHSRIPRIAFSFGDNEYKYNYFRVPYNSDNPFIIISELKAKLKEPKIKRIISDEKGFGYREFDLRDFVNSLFLFLGKDDSKWKKYKNWDCEEYILKPIYLL